MAKVIIEAERTAYSIKDVRRTMTVCELIAYLEQFDDDAPVYLSHDNGYTYGGITYDSFIDPDEIDDEDEDDDEEAEDDE